MPGTQMPRTTRCRSRVEWQWIRLARWPMITFTNKGIFGPFGFRSHICAIAQLLVD
jgi:hypothetical protein